MNLRSGVVAAGVLAAVCVFARPVFGQSVSVSYWDGDATIGVTYPDGSSVTISDPNYQSDGNGWVSLANNYTSATALFGAVSYAAGVDSGGNAQTYGGGSVIGVACANGVWAILDTSPGGNVGTPYGPPIDTGAPSHAGLSDATYDSAPPAPTCVPSDTCQDAATIFHTNSDCSSNTVACPYASFGYGCSAGGCLTPPPPQASFTVKPVLIRRGSTVMLEWYDASTERPSLASCTAVGTDGETWTATSGSVTSLPIVSQTVFTLSCIGIDGTSIQPLRYTVNVVPLYLER